MPSHSIGLAGIAASSLVLFDCNALLGNDAWTLAADGGDAEVGVDQAAFDAKTEGDADAGADTGWDAREGDTTGNDGAPLADGSDAPVTCQGSMCPLATAISPYAVAVDATRLYFTDPGAGMVASVPLGGGAVDVLASGLHGPSDILIDATYVYWLGHDSPPDSGTGSGNIGQIMKGGGAQSAVASRIDDSLYGLGVYNGGFLWATTSGLNELVPGYGVLVLTSNQNISGVGGFAADSTGIYASYDSFSGVGSLVSIIDIDGTGLDTRQTTLYSYGAAQAFGPAALDDANLYFFDATDGTVDALPKNAFAGPPPTVVVNNQQNVVGMATDATSVYWTSEGTAANGYADGTVSRAPIGGGALPTLLATGQRRPHGIAVDGARVYWANRGDGTIWAIGK